MKKQNVKDLSKLALGGLLSGTFGFSVTAMEPAPASPGMAYVKLQNQYSEIHGCSGLNSCKGLGGCKVDAAKLAMLATKAGVPWDNAGSPHECSGLNECKGLGGCSVDEAKLAMLKAKLDANYSEIHDCSGLNTCKGLGGCKVTADQLKTMATSMGVPLEKAGTAHSCKGLNECKGLGGCSVDAEKLAKLKENLEQHQ